VLHDLLALHNFYHDSGDALSKSESDFFSLEGVIQDVGKCIDKVV
jgi:hypothetical protein